MDGPLLTVQSVCIIIIELDFSQKLKKQQQSATGGNKFAVKDSDYENVELFWCKSTPVHHVAVPVTYQVYCDYKV